MLEENGVPYAKEAWVNLQGYIEGTSQADLSVKSAQLTAALRIFGLDLSLRTDAGAVLESLTNAAAIIPVRCVDGPNFIGQTGNEYGNYREFTATFSAVYPVVQTGIVVIDLTSALETGGGFQTVVYLPDINGGKAQRQDTTGPMPFEALQSGSVKSRGGYYPVPPPYLPKGALIDNPKISRLNRKTRTGTEFLVSWAYQYRSNTPFNALPL